MFDEPDLRQTNKQTNDLTLLRGVSVIPFGIDLAARALGPVESKWRQPQSAEDLLEEWRVRDRTLCVEMVQVDFVLTSVLVDHDVMFIRAVGVVAANDIVP